MRASLLLAISMMILPSQLYAQALSDAVESQRNFIASYGEAPISIMFAPADSAEYLDHILRYERDGLTGLDISTEDKAALEAINNSSSAAIGEQQPPVIYTHYHLSSIIYHSPERWSAHINGITLNRENNSPENELYINSITDKKATITWRPQDERLIPSMQNFIDQNDVPTLPNLMLHRLVSNSRPYIDADTISFTLEPNQFLASGYMKILEGRSDALPPLSILPYTQQELEELAETGADAPVRILSSSERTQPDETALEDIEPGSLSLDDIEEKISNTKRSTLQEKILDSVSQ